MKTDLYLQNKWRSVYCNLNSNKVDLQCHWSLIILNKDGCSAYFPKYLPSCAPIFSVTRNVYLCIFCIGLLIVNIFGAHPSYFTRQLLTPIGFKWDDNTCPLSQMLLHFPLWGLNDSQTMNRKWSKNQWIMFKWHQSINKKALAYYSML